jgi:alpha-ketoglutarate-dependent taurine dioxygenase
LPVVTLGKYIGAEVLKVDRDSLLNDDDLPQACMDALEEHGVLLLRELTIDDETQAALPEAGETRSLP